MAWIGTHPALMILVPDWITYALALCGLISALAAALKIIHQGFQIVRNGWMALTKPWRLVDQIEDLIEEQDPCRHEPPPAK